MVFVLFIYPGKSSKKENYFFGEKNILEIKGKEGEIEIEIADSEKERERGFSGRAFLCSNCGMLFVFPQKQRASFWMKDMRFDLDIIWITDGKIAHIEKNVGFEDKNIKNPDILVDWVLEINSGRASELSFDLGDEIVLKD